MNVLLISEDTLRTNSNLNENCFGKWILPAIREAQEMGLMPLIGECFYNKICELVEDGTIGEIEFIQYKDLLDGYIQPYLIYQTLTNIVPILNGKLGNIGTVNTTDEHIVSLSQGEQDLLQNYYRERAEFYQRRLSEWVKAHADSFPELSCFCGMEQPHLDRNTNSVGLWLGGMRGRKLAKPCGCGGTTSGGGGGGGEYQQGYENGYRDGRTYQKSLVSGLTITENGTYSGSNGYSPVVVDIDTTSVYNEGVEDGKEAQKALLSNSAFTENGVYQRHDGWSAVTVNVPQYTGGSIEAPKTVIIDSRSQTILPDAGYDGMARVDIDASAYGDAAYDAGAGYVRANMMYLNIGINNDGDIYDDSRGYRQVTVDLGIEDLVSKTIYNNPVAYVFPSTGKNAMKRVTVDATQYGTNQYNSGYTDGYAAGQGSGVDICDFVNKTLTDVNLPECITTVPADTFSGFTLLSSVTISSACTSIGDRAFKGCAFESIDLPSGLTSIESAAFQNCDNLLSMVVPSGCSVKNGAFYGCDNLQDITLDNPNYNVLDASQTFCYCPNLSVITFRTGIGSNGGLSIGPTYSGCTSLSKIYLKDGVTSVYTTALWKLIAGQIGEPDCAYVSTIVCDSVIAPSFNYETYPKTTADFVGTSGTLYVPTGADYSSWLDLLGSGWTVVYQ